MPRRDSLGQTYFLTGFQTFVSVNTRNGTLTGSITQDAPMRPSAESVITITIPATALAGLKCQVTATLDNMDLQLQSSPPVGPGVSFNGDYRLIVSQQAYAPGTDILLAPSLSAKFGTLQVGQKFFLRAIATSNGLVIGRATNQFVIT
jgi:hypothetical protein